MRVLPLFGAGVLVVPLLASSPSAAQLPPPSPPRPTPALEQLPPPSNPPDGPVRPSSPSSEPPPGGRRESGASRGRVVPPEHTGFQISARTGVALPYGSAARGSDMSDVFGAQAPLVVDIGGKAFRSIFLGVALGVAFGGAAGARASDCERGNRGCSAFRATVGLMFQYHFLPEADANPWLGYGIGWEIAALNESEPNAGTALNGLEFARVLFGVDFRLGRWVGVGPFVESSFGQYFVRSTARSSNDIDGGSVHGWLTLGARVVLFR